MVAVYFLYTEPLLWSTRSFARLYQQHVMDSLLLMSRIFI